MGTKVAVGGPATVGAGWGASALLGKIMTDPEADAKAVKVLQSNMALAATANIYRQAVAPALGGSPAQQH